MSDEEAGHHFERNQIYRERSSVLRDLNNLPMEEPQEKVPGWKPCPLERVGNRPRGSRGIW